MMDLGAKTIELFKKFELQDFALVKEDEPAGFYDFALVEGSSVTEENFKKLKDLRKRTKKLIAFGTCAHLGGVQEMKNYYDLAKTYRAVYRFKGIANPKIVPISKVVKVDYVIPGCPISGEEFLAIMESLAEGQEPKIPERPVCYECQKNGNECLLLKGEACLGPITLAGCNSVCLNSGVRCSACRGPLADTNIKSLKDLINGFKGEKTLLKIMELFGARDEIEEIENKSKISNS